MIAKEAKAKRIAGNIQRIGRIGSIENSRIKNSTILWDRLNARLSQLSVARRNVAHPGPMPAGNQRAQPRFRGVPADDREPKAEAGQWSD